MDYFSWDTMRICDSLNVYALIEFTSWRLAANSSNDRKASNGGVCLLLQHHHQNHIIRVYTHIRKWHNTCTYTRNLHCTETPIKFAASIDWIYSTNCRRRSSIPFAVAMCSITSTWGFNHVYLRYIHTHTCTHPRKPDWCGGMCLQIIVSTF